MPLTLDELAKNLEPELLELFKEDKTDLVRFTQKYPVSLLKIEENNENLPKKELIYLFDDNRGGYTSEGIAASLKE